MQEYSRHLIDFLSVQSDFQTSKDQCLSEAANLHNSDKGYILLTDFFKTVHLFLFDPICLFFFGQNPSQGVK